MDKRAMEMTLCPFCGGPPVLDATKMIAGDVVSAHVWCHECGAQGPKMNDYSGDNANDVAELRRQAIEAWNLRNDRHRGMFEHAVREGLNRFPRDAAVKP